MQLSSPSNVTGTNPVQRVRFWYGLLVLLFGVFIIRLFYLQVIRYDYYEKAAMSDQLKEYVVPASRGLIEAHEGNSIVPLVLNQKLYTLFVDPTLVKQPGKVASAIVGVIGGKVGTVESELRTPHTRYVVLARKITSAQSKKILSYKFPGVGTQEQDYRTYPDGSLASQLLGFVNDQGQGEYGVEQALNNVLAGKAGRLKAVTDINGVPLAASPGNLSIQPVPGSNVVLSIDAGMQTQMEQILAKEQKVLKSKDLSAVIMDPYTGEVKAMANVPTYNPANYQNVSDPRIFENKAVTDAIEPGSIMKTLTTAAALNQHVITPNSTFYDPAHWLVDGFNITDIAMDGGAREQSIRSTLNLSLNTGATWMLMQMGGGKIDRRGRDAWYNYMTKHYRLGQETGIEQGYESPGYVPLPENNGAGINLTYANTAFGQAVTITPLQMAAAYSSVLNGGTYYQPHLVDQIISPDGKKTTIKPKVLVHNVVSPKVSSEIPPLLEYVVKKHYEAGYYYMKFSSQYSVGGKTGTAQIAKPSGGYYANKYNGTYGGFVGGNKPQYVIVVYSIEPHVYGYAGTGAGQLIFGALAHMLINNFGVTPKG